MDGKARVLIVEDELIVALDLKVTLTRLGYFVTGIAPTVKQAFEFIYQHHPDIILMDINLKDKINGIDIAEKISPEKIPVLFVTAQNDESTIQRIKNLSCRYILKPYNEEQLRENILHELSKN